MNGLQLEIINPLEYPGWDDLLLSQEKYSFFHSSHWARVLHESYHYRPLYFTQIDQGRISVMVPLMEVKSLLTGKRGVGLPFTDYCEPIIYEKSTSREIMNYLIRFGKKAGWGSIELRPANGLFPEFPASSYYYVHTLDLTPGEERIFSNFRDTTKRNIKKAVKEGVAVSLDHSEDSVEDFYRRNCETRKEHGLPPQPYYFFKKIHDHVISQNLGFIALASYNGWKIAGAIYLHSRGKTIYKYGASLKSYQHLRPNNLVMWEAIRWSSQNGYRSLCFGRTEPENAGLRQFKNGWGTDEKIINYYKYNLCKNSFVNSNSQGVGFYARIFRSMPIPLLKIIGRAMYRHVG